MKTISVKEAQATYGLDIDEEKLAQSPLFIERDGNRLAVVISAADYDAFHTWQEAQERERSHQEDTEAFERERAAYERLKPQLLRTHRGQCVAILNGEVVEIGDDKMDVLGRVYERFGYVPVFVQRVEEQPRVYKFPHRKSIR